MFCGFFSDKKEQLSNDLKKYDIKSKLISNHKFNEKKNLVKIIEYLKSGKIIS